ncbi:MAG: hypothetical protein KAU28_06490 [Phycisphaerae bacterium]|nr:hypothetical protein [Phycisphaerae bacterium]
MLDIPVPPLPQLTAAHSWLLAGACVVVGVVLLLSGRKFGCALLVLAGAGIGLSVAPILAERFGINPLAVRVVAAIVLAIIGLTMARLIWAIIASVFFAEAAGAILFARFVPQLSEKVRPAFGASEPFGAWCLAAHEYYLAGMGALWNEHSLGLLLVLAAAFVLPLAVFLVRPRLSAIFATSLLGGVSIMTGVTVAAANIRQPLWPGNWATWAVLGAVAAAMLVTGLVAQYRVVLAADRKERGHEVAPPKNLKKKDRKAEEEQ